MSLTWQFNKIELRAGMVIENAFDETLNNVEYDIAATLGREVIQNAIDARLDKEKPVKISFTWKDFEKDEFFLKYTDGLTKRLERMEGGIRIKEKNYKQNPSFLIIEDFNTKGLTGKFDANDEEEKKRRLEGKIKNNFLSYFFKLGSSEKKGTEGGRRGAGRTTLNGASYLRTQYIISKRSDDEQKILMGLCVGKSHFLDDEPSEYAGYGHYVEQDDKGLYLPSTNNEKIEELSSKLGLNRGNNYGTSFIIPYPIAKIMQHQTILTKCLESYFTVIKEGHLELEFNTSSYSVAINANNVQDILNNYNLDVESDFLNFISDCKKLNENQVITLKDDAANDGVIDIHDFIDAKKQLPELRRDFLNNKPIGLKIPVNFQKIGEDKVYSSYFKVFISKTHHARGKVMFIRGNMALIGEGQRGFPKNCFGYFIAEEDSIVSLIADSEGVNHTRIQPDHNTIQEKYEEGTNLVLGAMKKSLISFANLLLNPDDEDDTTSLATYFPVNQGAEIYSVNESDEFEEVDANDEGSNIDTSSKKEDTNITPSLVNIIGQQPTYIIKPIAAESGFQVTANPHKESISEYFPKKLKIKVTYSEPGKKKGAYEPLDFDFNEQKTLKIELEKVRILQKQKNIIELEAEDENFKVKVTNFFELYGLEVNLV